MPERTRSFNGRRLALVVLITLTLFSGVATGLLVLPIHRSPNIVAWSTFNAALQGNTLRSITVHNEGSTYFFVGTSLQGSPDIATRIPTAALDAKGWKDLSALASAHGATLEFAPARATSRMWLWGLTATTGALLLATLAMILFVVLVPRKVLPPPLPQP